MATPVPYEGAPDRAPGFDPTPTLGVQANPAAFGTNVAEAAGHLGQVVEGAGKELFDRAYAMQDLQLHADVNARLSDALNKSQNLFVDYSNLEGKKAVDALPEYQNKLDEVREKGGDGLSPIGQEYYDTESRNARNRLGFLGASHAVGEQKKFVNGAADASISSSMKMMEIDPRDPSTTDAAIKNIRDQVQHKFGDIGGMSADEVKIKQSDAVNEAIQGRIKALAKDDPIGAQKLLDKAVADKDVYGNGSTELSWYVRNQRDQIGSRQTAHAVMNGGAGFDLDNAKVSPDQLLAGLKGSEGGSYTFTGPDVTDKSGNTGHAIGHYGVMSYNLQPWLKEAGLPAMSEEQFKQDENAQDALAKFKMTQYQDKFGSAHAAAIAWFGGEGSVGANLAQLHDKNMNGLTYLSNFDGGVAHGSTLQQLTTAGRSVAKSQFPDDEAYHDFVEDKIITQYNKERSIQRDTDFQNDQTLAGALVGGIGKDKQLPTSVDMLKQDPQAAQAWDALQSSHPSELQKYLRQMASNAKGDVAMTPERLNQWQTLNGQAVGDPEGFMKATQDLSTVDLPRAEKMQIIKMQQSIYRKQDAAPQVSHALSLLGQTGVLQSAGLTKDQDPDNLHLFTGVLQDAMTQYNQANGKSMDDQTIKDTAQQLLTSVPGAHFWNGSKPWFQSVDSVPPEAAAAISEEFQKRNVMPSESAILQAYIAAQYQEIYGKAPKAKP